MFDLYSYHVISTHSVYYCYSDVIDVTYVEPHSLERSELMGRTRDYQ